MKRFIINAVVVAVGLGASLAPQAGQAGEFDLRTGFGYEGNWCTFSARFDIQNDLGNGNYEGKVFLFATKQYDDIVIKQFDNGSLRIERKLSGAHSGKSQYMWTHRPERLIVKGKTLANFPTRATKGYGAKLAGFLKMPLN